MLKSDRVFGAVVIFLAFIYVSGATSITRPFFSDPLMPKIYPIIVGCLVAICGAVVMFSSVWKTE